MKLLRELFGDLLIATGAAVVLFSVGLVVLILVVAVPTGNPYIGVFTALLLPALFLIGGIIFILGMAASGKGDRAGS